MEAVLHTPPKPVDSPVSRLIAVAARYPRTIVLTHDNPDPDGIASGWALVTLFEQTLRRPCKFLAGGEIVRAENRKMVSLLRPPLQLGDWAGYDTGALLVLVDCDVDTQNHPKIDVETQPVAVIDHHTRSKAAPGALFQDRRPSIAATSTIIASYLKERGLTPSRDVATALTYGIRTETKAGQTSYSELDHSMLTWVTGLGNPSHVAEIEDAPLSLPYFSDLVLALQNTTVYGKAAFCIVPNPQGPEVVGEVADLLVRCDRIQSVFVGALYHGNIVLSVRERPPDRNAARTAVAVLEGIGHGGGHACRAGGIVKDVGADGRRVISVIDDLRRRFLAVCASEGETPRRLVARDEILKNL